MGDRVPEPPQPPIFNLNAYSPAEIQDSVETIGVKKATLPFLSSLMLAVMAGVVLASARFTTSSSPAMRI